MSSAPGRRIVSPTVERLPAYEAGRSIEQVRRELGLAEVIKLASNENPLGPSPRAVEAMTRALADTHRYPDDGAALRQELASRHGVTPAQLVLGAGATDLIELCVHTFCTPSDHAVVSAGSFLAYRLFLMASGVPFTEVPLAADASIDLDALAAAVRPDTRLIFLPNPNNPTGSCFGRAAFQRLLLRLPADVVLVLDDAYADFQDPVDAPDTIAAIRTRPNTVVLRSFSKSHGLAGMRVGYAVAAEELTGYLRRVLRPFAVSRVAMEGARAALLDTEHLERTVALVRTGRALLTEALGGLGMSVLRSHANFVTVDLGAEESVRSLTAALLLKGLVVRPLAAFGMPDHLRVTVGDARENQALITAVRELKNQGFELSRKRR